MPEGKILKQNRIKFLLLMAFTGILLMFRSYDNLVISYNSTLMALSYKYGFISRGLFGTIYAGLDAVLPFNLMTYENLKLFFLLLTICFLVFYLYFANKCLSLVDEKYIKNQQLLLLFYMVFLVTFFTCSHNLGRVDICMCAIAILSAILIMTDRCVWLCIPLSAIAVMFHQGYVFMFFNITLVLLLYRAMSDRQKTKKYLIIFALSFLVGSAFFLYFEFFSHSGGEAFYDEVVEKALNLGEKEEGYHEGLIQHEILGIDLSESEEEYRLKNRVEFPIFILMFSPYLVILYRLFSGLIRKAKDKIEKCKYIFLAIGSLTILPNMILKCDYARWIFAVMTYYVITLLALHVMGDVKVSQGLFEINSDLKTKPWHIILFILPILFTPFWDVNICRVSAHLGGDLNKWFFHLWVDVW